MNNNPNQSDNIGKLAEALAKAQGTLKAAAKSTENTFYKASYSDLPTVMATCRQALSENNIAVIQTTHFSPRDEQGHGDMWLETVLAHSSGEWIKGQYPIRPTKPDMQGVLSAITYARRGALMAAVGIVADDSDAIDADDDGNRASGMSAPPPKHAPTQAPNPKKAAETAATKAMSDTNKTAAETFYWECIKALNLGFDSLAEFDKWHNPLLGKIAKLKAYNETNHQKLMKEIEVCQIKLGAHMTTVDDGGNSYQVRV